MDLPPGPSNEPGDLNSDDDNVSNATDDQHYDSNTDSEYDPDYEASPIVWAANIVRRTNAYALELFCGPNTTPKSRICMERSDC